MVFGVKGLNYSNKTYTSNTEHTHRCVNLIPETHLPALTNTTNMLQNLTPIAAVGFGLETFAQPYSCTPYPPN